MTHAIYAPTLREYADVRRLVGLAQAAERSGYDGFFIWDVLFMERGAPAANAEYGWVGEEVDAKARASRLDEGLKVLDPLLRGLAVTHAGKHYRISDALAVSKCVQSQRPPILVRAALPARAEVRGAAHWDGLVPILSPAYPVMRDDGSFDMAQTRPTAAQFGESVDTVRECRVALSLARDLAGFDLVASGSTAKCTEVEARAKLAPYPAIGVAWWTEWLDDRAGTYAASLALCE